MTRRCTLRRTLRCAAAPAQKTLAALCLALLCCCAAVRVADAASLEDYGARVLRAAEALEELHWTFNELEDGEDSKSFNEYEEATLAEVRAALPASEKIEGSGVALDVDNRWLHGELDLYAKLAADKRDERDAVLYRLAGRLRALATQLSEAATVAAAARDKEAEKGRLQAILRRPEYNQQAAEDTAFERFKRQVREWIKSMMPKSRPLNEGTATAFSLVARLFVFALTVAVIIFVVWKYGALLLPRNRAKKKKAQAEARVVLGERLAPGQTPAGLINEAEALARAGDLRGAIRKAYIAVLVELGERRILRLAAHKTNRDYLSAIRHGERAALYGDMQPLTHNYERHWYGFAPATDADWHDFRTRCQQLTQ